MDRSPQRFYAAAAVAVAVAAAVNIAPTNGFHGEPCQSGSLLICSIFPAMPQLDDDIDLTTDANRPGDGHAPNPATDRG